MLTHCIRSASPCTLDADQSPGSRLLISAATRRPLPPQLLVVPHGIRFGRAMYGVGTRMKRKGKGCVFRKRMKTSDSVVATAVTLAETASGFHETLVNTLLPLLFLF